MSVTLKPFAPSPPSTPGLLADQTLALLWPTAGLSDEEAEQRRLAETDLRAYIRAAWHVVEPAVAFVPGFHLDAIAEHLQAVTAGQLRNLLINVPPRHMKSLASSVFWPSWEWIRHPEIRWLFASYASSLSTRDSLKCRRLIESRWYRERWGHRYRLTSDQNVKTRYDTDKTGYRLATSVEGLGTGEGGDRIVVDDPHSAMEASSDAVREATLIWWDETMSTRGNDPKTAAKVIVMQRLHERDLSGHVLEQGGYEHLCLPAEYEPTTMVTGIGWADPRTEPGELLWPERFGRAEIEALKRALGSRAAAGQLQQRPAPAEGDLLKRVWWRFWHHPGLPLDPVPLRQANGEIVHLPCLPLPHAFDEVVQSWDMTFKDTKSADYVVGQVWGARQADRFLLGQSRGIRDFPATVAAVRAMTATWPDAGRKFVEDAANGPAVIDTLKREIAGLLPVPTGGGKVVRANAVSYQIESGNVYLPHPSIAGWVHDLIEEAAAFPGGKHDDMVDAMTHALAQLDARMRHTDAGPALLPGGTLFQLDAESSFTIEDDEY